MVESLQEQPAGREPAPDALELVQAFVNTNDREGRTDEFARRELAQKWLSEHGLLGKGEPVAATDFVWLVEVREALRAVAATNNGLSPDERAIAVLDDAVSRTLVVRFTSDGAAVQPVGAGVARAVGRLLAIVVEAIRDGTWPRLKACRRDICRWVFYDHSRNRSSSWCAMEICGNRTKTRAYRRRRRSDGHE